MILNWNIRGVTTAVRNTLNAILECRLSEIVCIQEPKTTYPEVDRNYQFRVDGFETYTPINGYGKIATLVRAGTNHIYIPFEFDWNDQVDREIDDSDRDAVYYDGNKEISWAAWRRAKLQTKLYATAIDCWSDDTNLIIVNHYRPQQGPCGGCDPKRITEYLKQLQRQHPDHGIVLAADANAHDPAWMHNASPLYYGSSARKAGRVLNKW